MVSGQVRDQESEAPATAMELATATELAMALEVLVVPLQQSPFLHQLEGPAQAPVLGLVPGLAQDWALAAALVVLELVVPELVATETAVEFPTMAMELGMEAPAMVLVAAAGLAAFRPSPYSPLALVQASGVLVTATVTADQVSAAQEVLALGLDLEAVTTATVRMAQA